MKANATFLIPKGVNLTEKENGNVCIVVEGKVVDGEMQSVRMMSIDDYMNSGDETEKNSEKKPMPKGKKKRPARIAAILGDDEGMGY